jgi:hypothetical protein
MALGQRGGEMKKNTGKAPPLQSPLQVRLLRELLTGTAPDAHLSAASALVRIGPCIHVVADDELHLASFELDGHAPGRLKRLFKGRLPDEYEARKAAKPDLEALCLLPACADYPFGALLALGSGSKKRRHRAALLALGADGAPRRRARVVDLEPLLATLDKRLPRLNIEGAFISGGDTLCLLQRGDGRKRVNACIRFDWPAVRRWLLEDGPVPSPESITDYALGALDGVPLGFTDGAALPACAGGGWVFSAAAEDTSDSTTDGQCLGSCIGRVDADGELRWLRRVALCCKVEGIAAELSGDALELLLVTDADDRRRPALLLSASVAGNQ